MEGKLEGLEEGIEKGRAEGIEKARLEKLEIAQNLLAMGMDKETISKATGLSLQDIES